MHAAHRNPSVPDHYTSDMIINDTMVHDIDVARWMFDDEIAAVTVLTAAAQPQGAGGLQRPAVRAAGDAGAGCSSTWRRR